MSVVVAIDGAAGSGKSTLARALAIELGLPYLNTGLMYRALALVALRERTDHDDGEALADLARRLTFDLDRTLDPPALTVEGETPGPELRSPEVEAIVSRVARHPQVRAVLREVQRSLIADGAVVEGRDIGSVVAPEADAKIFLHAAAGERADRRAVERGSAPAPAVGEALADRDRADARTNPFVPADDAVVIDTTTLDRRGVLEVALRAVRARLGRGPGLEDER